MMNGEFLLEIGTEEIPAGFVKVALESLENLFSKALDTLRIDHGPFHTYATPRRIIIHIEKVEAHQQDREIEKTGPSVSSAFDEHGKPTKAAIGFAKSQGVDVTDLVRVSTSRGEQLAIRKVELGRPTIEVLSMVIPDIMEKMSFPKTMRWMDLDVRFARPIHWIVAMLHGEVVPFAYGNIQSGKTSRGHRFVGPKHFEVTSFEGLRTSLEVHDVILDPKKRQEKIIQQVMELAGSHGLRVFDDPDLLEEINFLVESPHPVMGEFSETFLELPASILITCMKKHQRYFALQDGKGRIANKFIAINNTPVRDLQVSINGHQRVLRARLEDARFYFREDRKTPLFERLEALKGVVFHSKLGTAHEKVQRFTHIAKKISEIMAPDKENQVERAAQLCKCDLETGIVYEFPELQGIIGSYYAKKDGELEEVATAIREHYLPAFSGDNLPQGIIGAIVSIADRIDTIVGCFSVGIVPTGTADPYALRRHALAIIQILIQWDKSLDLTFLIREALAQLGPYKVRPNEEITQDVVEFFRTRFINFHTTRNYSLDVVEAVVRSGFDDVVDVRKRVDALSEWKKRDDFESIVVGFKRVSNILKDAQPTAL
ncbi:MAG: glycyl-tRNA synthetase beta chain, partial [Thermodesulfobacteriota bacterium]|nr:glycyl-tRNA synthetase beta chain [Thermodesulfobacteriota bacterium]